MRRGLLAIALVVELLACKRRYGQRAEPPPELTIPQAEQMIRQDLFNRTPDVSLDRVESVNIRASDGAGDGHAEAKAVLSMSGGALAPRTLCAHFTYNRRAKAWEFDTINTDGCVYAGSAGP